MSVVGLGPEDGWVDVGDLGQFPPGQPTIVTVGGIELGIVNLEDHGVRAVRNYCPHRGAPIGAAGFVTTTFSPCEPSALVVNLTTVIRCPWHKWEFDLDTGRPAYGISTMQLQVHEAAVVAGRVWINPARQRPRRQPVVQDSVDRTTADTQASERTS